jgi:hypothetical protein
MDILDTMRYYRIGDYNENTLAKGLLTREAFRF